MLLTAQLPADGTVRIWHVYTPALQHRLDPKNAGCDLPVIALRTSKDGYRSFVLVRDVTGHCSLFERLDQPLPGTSGRAVCYCSSHKTIRISYRSDQTAVIQAGDDRDPKDILADVLRFYLTPSSPR